MTTNRRTLRLVAPVAAALLFVVTLPAAAQPEAPAQGAAATPSSGLQTELTEDLQQLEAKYLGLAEVMDGKYGWRPGEGVRSVGEVLIHVANANLLLSTIVGVELPEAFRGTDMQDTMARLGAREQTTDKQAVQDALRQSFEHVRRGIALVTDDQLDAPVQLFGQNATKRRVLNLIVTHLHEHLGQSIAYARTSGVTPPWSE